MISLSFISDQRVYVTIFKGEYALKFHMVFIFFPFLVIVNSYKVSVLIFCLFVCLFFICLFELNRICGSEVVAISGEVVWNVQTLWYRGLLICVKMLTVLFFSKFMKNIFDQNSCNCNKALNLESRIMMLVEEWHCMLSHNPFSKCLDLFIM